jgi:predicted nuclease of predicted toxin-antitoxin system
VNSIMQFLANENMPLDVVEAIRAEGHEVAWIRSDAPGSKDIDVLRRAVAENLVLPTVDKDFGELAFRFGLPATCGIVLFRLQAESSAALAIEVAAAIRSRTDWADQFSVVERGRIRVRPLPQRHEIAIILGREGKRWFSTIAGRKTKMKQGTTCRMITVGGRRC